MAGARKKSSLSGELANCAGTAICDRLDPPIAASRCPYFPIRAIPSALRQMNGCILTKSIHTLSAAPS